MSAYTTLKVTLNFNKTALDPPVCKVVINENPDASRIWTLHGSWGCHIRPDMEHYSCHNIYVNTTIVEIVGYTVKLSPHNTNIPFISSADLAALDS